MEILFRCLCARLLRPYKKSSVSLQVRLLSASRNGQRYCGCKRISPSADVRGYCYTASKRTCASVPPLTLPVGACSLQGRNKNNEDRYGHFSLAPNVQYFGVYDGHNGAFVSQFVHKNLPIIIENRLREIGPSLYDDIFSVVSELLRSSFQHCQNVLFETMEMMKHIEKKEMTGSTAVVGLLVDEKFLSIANVGDSQAILCRHKKAVELSVNHNPENSLEAERVKTAGGWIDWDSKLKPMVNGRLSVTRSFGNMLLKPDIVTCQPDIRHEVIDSNKDSFLVLCSDGVTHTVDLEEIMFILNQHDNAFDAAEDLATSAQQFGSQDDITAIVVPLEAWRCFEIRASKPNFSMFRTMMGGRADG